MSMLGVLCSLPGMQNHVQGRMAGPQHLSKQFRVQTGARALPPHTRSSPLWGQTRNPWQAVGLKAPCVHRALRPGSGEQRQRVQAWAGGKRKSTTLST